MRRGAFDDDAAGKAAGIWAILGYCRAPSGIKPRRSFHNHTRTGLVSTHRPS